MGHGPVKTDPAIERFNTMREEAYLHFRWTRRTVRTAVLGFIVVPAAMFFVADRFYLRWNMSGKLKGEPLATRSQATNGD